MGEARTAIEAFYDAFNRGDLEAARAVCADDIRNVDPSGEISGWDAFREFIQTFKTASPDSRLEMSMIIEDGNRAAGEGRFVGTFTAPLRTPQGELPPTGGAFELPFAEVNVVEGGKITEHRVYYDQMAFLAALGAMPPAT